MKKLLLIIICAVLVAALLFSFSFCEGRVDYIDSNLKKYVSFTLDDFTGHNFTVSGDGLIVDDAAIDRDFRYWQLVYAELKENGRGLTVGTPGYGDRVYIYYYVSLSPNGQSVISNLNSNMETFHLDYTEIMDKVIQKGESKLFYEAAITAKLKETLPTGRVTDRAVQENDVLRVSYTAKKADGTTYRTYSSKREAVLGSSFAAHLIGKMPGDTFTFTQNETVDGQDIPLTYDFAIDCIASESVSIAELTLSSDCFGDNHTEAAQSLNGKHVYVHMMLEKYDDYQVPELDAAFFAQAYNYTVTQTDPDAIVAEARTYARHVLEEQRDDLIKEQMLSRYRSQLREYVKKIPNRLYSDYRDELLSEVETAYYSQKKEALANDETFHYQTIEEFAPDYCKYDATEYPTLLDYANASAEAVVADRLVLCYMAQLAGLRRTKEEYAKEYEAYVEYQYQSYVQQYGEETVQEIGGKEAIVNAMGGEEALLWWVTENTIAFDLKEYLFEHNTWSVS